MIAETQHTEQSVEYITRDEFNRRFDEMRDERTVVMREAIEPIEHRLDIMIRNVEMVSRAALSGADGVRKSMEHVEADVAAMRALVASHQDEIRQIRVLKRTAAVGFGLLTTFPALRWLRLLVGGLVHVAALLLAVGGGAALGLVLTILAGG